MPRRKLLEISHFHLFSMPVYLLILAHLYILSRSDERWKIFWILLASASTALHILSPWVATAGGALSAYLYASSGLGLALSYLVMSAVPLWEMWAPAPPSRPS